MAKRRKETKAIMSRCTECGKLGSRGAQSHECYRSYGVPVPGGRYGTKYVMVPHSAPTEHVEVRVSRVLTDWECPVCGRAQSAAWTRCCDTRCEGGRQSGASADECPLGPAQD